MMRCTVVGLLLVNLVLTVNVTAQDRSVLIKNGRLLDGTGNPWVLADVLIRGDRIEAVGRLGDVQADAIIDAAGLYVTPGFIDTHSHAGPGLGTANLSHGEPLLAMGITTIFANPDGVGPIDLAEQTVDWTRNRAKHCYWFCKPGGNVGGVGSYASVGPAWYGGGRLGSLVRHFLRSGKLRAP